MKSRILHIKNFSILAIAEKTGAKPKKKTA
jgi:hypothetical protein